MRIEQTVDIEAPPQRVWDVTIDLAQWPSWNPTVTDVSYLAPGEVRPGFRARLKQPGSAPAEWAVTHVEEPRRFE